MVETITDLPVCLSREHCIYKLVLPGALEDFYCKFNNRCTMQEVKT